MAKNFRGLVMGAAASAMAIAAIPASAATTTPVTPSSIYIDGTLIRGLSSVTSLLLGDDGLVIGGQPTIGSGNGGLVESLIEQVLPLASGPGGIATGLIGFSGLNVIGTGGSINSGTSYGVVDGLVLGLLGNGGLVRALLFGEQYNDLVLNVGGLLGTGLRLDPVLGGESDDALLGGLLGGSGDGLLGLGLLGGTGSGLVGGLPVVGGLLDGLLGGLLGGSGSGLLGGLPVVGGVLGGDGLLGLGLLGGDGLLGLGLLGGNGAGLVGGLPIVGGLLGGGLLGGVIGADGLVGGLVGGLL